MVSINRIFFAGAIISAAAAAVLASGCGVAGASGMQRAAEVRVATTLEAGSPKVIVSGPARLLHVDVHGHQTLNVYSVKRDAGGAASCAARARSEARALRQAASTELNLEVGDDEVVCLANSAGDAPRIDVSWHARRGVGAPSRDTGTPWRAIRDVSSAERASRARGRRRASRRRRSGSGGAPCPPETAARP